MKISSWEELIIVVMTNVSRMKLLSNEQEDEVSRHWREGTMIVVKAMAK